MVSLEEFKKLQLRVARIKQVKDHPRADKLYVLTIDLGDTDKQIVAGIRSAYRAEELMGRQIVVVNNLEPVSIRGVESQAMLLAAADEQGVSILSPDREVAAGSAIR